MCVRAGGHVDVGVCRRAMHVCLRQVLAAVPAGEGAGRRGARHLAAAAAACCTTPLSVPASVTPTPHPHHTNTYPHPHNTHTHTTPPLPTLTPTPTHLPTPTPHLPTPTPPQGQHERSVEWFRRALRLCRTYLSAWTLMGHEFVEMKNAPAAIGGWVWVGVWRAGGGGRGLDCGCA